MGRKIQAILNDLVLTLAKRGNSTGYQGVLKPLMADISMSTNDDEVNRAAIFTSDNTYLSVIDCNIYLSIGSVCESKPEMAHARKEAR